MKRKTTIELLLTVAALLCAASAGAQMYKWTDAKGVTHFSDSPPASATDKAEVRTYGSGASSPALPYEVAQAARAHPVTLFTAPGCAPCDQGRSYLQQRGIPYSEKSVSNGDDAQKLKEAGSNGQLPLLAVGSTRLLGFQQQGWSDALNAAGYPAQSTLPRGYQFVQATPAAPRKPSAKELAAERAAQAAAEAAEKAKFAPKPPAINGTPDFQF